MSFMFSISLESEKQQIRVKKINCKLSACFLPIGVVTDKRFGQIDGQLNDKYMQNDLISCVPVFVGDGWFCGALVLVWTLDKAK